MKIECPDCDRVLEFVDPKLPVEPWVRMYGEVLSKELGRMRCPWCTGGAKHLAEERAVTAIGSWSQLPSEDQQSVYDKISRLQAKYDKEVKKEKEGSIRFKRANQMSQALRFAVQALKDVESEPIPDDHRYEMDLHRVPEEHIPVALAGSGDLDYDLNEDEVPF